LRGSVNRALHGTRCGNRVEQVGDAGDVGVVRLQAARLLDVGSRREVHQHLGTMAGNSGD
jgi:hypothetical protein